ncbi:flavodoxin family protein [Pediococcus stilesii]|uniref:Flavodoxin family protein n=1 Tax=Pediococcus stilesii TaxID=331679 RepID=A0A5R9BWB5_9LACO|nr:NAD(P)H-dependent oxidoreductase [Pediococcus stilesii]TLQ04301.1 flavodoxin family protein [Pediococcus stilesii]
MKTLVIVAHPQLENSDVQPFFREAIADFPDVTWHPLTSSFDVLEEQKLLISNDRIIFEFPLYWYSAPALLKQWLDDVFTMKFTTGNRYALAGKELGIVVSTGDKERSFRAGEEEQFTISELMRPYQALAGKARMRYLPVLAVYQFLYLSPDEQQRLMIRYQQYLTNPKFEHFSEQSEWFQEQLRKRIQTNETTAPELEQILNLIQDNQDELDDLQWNLSELKKEEDS